MATYALGVIGGVEIIPYLEAAMLDQGSDCEGHTIQEEARNFLSLLR